MLNNVKDFGAVGDGITDDRVAIQAAIDNAARFKQQAGILFPPGTYRVSKVTSPGGRWSLDLSGMQDFMVVGEGPESVVKLVDTTQKTGDWHAFILRKGQENCRRVVFKDLVIDGNHTGLADPDEQSHGIEVESGTEDLVVDRCILRECFGDGIRLLGQPGQNVKRLRIVNCLFQTNKRSGIVVQHNCEQILIANCIFDRTSSGDNSIDFEPRDKNANAPTDLVVQGCLINHPRGGRAVHLSGIGGSNPLVRCKFSDNVLLGGVIFCVDVDQLSIQNNIVQAKLTNGLPLVGVTRSGERVVISGNLLVNDDASAEAVISLREGNQDQMARALITDNLCFTPSGNGIKCISSDDVAIQGNLIVATGSCDDGIFIRPETSPMDNISVRDNDITVEGTGKWDSGISIATNEGKPIHHFSVIGNSVRSAANGIALVAGSKSSHFKQTPVIALNRIADDVLSALVGIENLPFASVVVGGATSRGGTTETSGAGRFIAGIGDPEDRVIGNVGDIFQRLDGKAGETLYVKETGNGSTSGWKAK
jgi:Pectate lyase superfamily protein